MKRFGAMGAALALAACSPSYSPDTYASSSVQQASRVEQGTVVGVRKVAVQASGTTGAVTGGAAGGIAGSQAPVGTAFTTLGGTLVGGLIGSGIERAAGDTMAYEYIVRKPNGELVSVTQTDTVPLALGQRVLVIAGTQARIVADYTMPPELPAPNRSAVASEPPKPEASQPPESTPAPAPAEPEPSSP